VQAQEAPQSWQAGRGELQAQVTIQGQQASLLTPWLQEMEDLVVA
jgi:hypothetical protein